MFFLGLILHAMTLPACTQAHVRNSPANKYPNGVVQ